MFMQWFHYNFLSNETATLLDDSHFVALINATNTCHIAWSICLEAS